MHESTVRAVMSSAMSDAGSYFMCNVAMESRCATIERRAAAGSFSVRRQSTVDL